ncbi:MAG: epoxide hydrolase [Myxococcota bacterium]|nr:epoxide hydrolase [Myxococcota bacterium]
MSDGVPLGARAFRVAIDPAVVDGVRARVRAASLPDPIGEGWEHGTDVEYVRAFREHWVERYAWSRAEERLNAHPQFVAEIGGLDIHFYWEKASRPSAPAIVLTHGWPGSAVEFLGAIEKIAHPERFGGVAGDGFDVVVPTLPGFGFSGKPRAPIGPRETARLWRRLMTEVLGYECFFAQGGDLGSMVTAYLGGEHADVVRAIHLNFVPVREVAPVAMTAEERAWSEAANEYRALELDYFRLLMHKPQTLAFALADSPLGCAAWMLEKFRSWSDCGGDLDAAFGKDDLITNVMLYVATGRADSSLWFYRGFFLEAGGRTHSPDAVAVPTGIAIFPRDMINGRPPRSWAERDYRVVRWREMPRGGHFACMEQPDLFVSEVREYFRSCEQEGASP